MEKLILALDNVIDRGADADFHRDDDKFTSIYRKEGTISIQGISSDSIGLTEKDARELRDKLREARRYDE